MDLISFANHFSTADFVLPLRLCVSSFDFITAFSQGVSDELVEQLDRAVSVVSTIVSGGLTRNDPHFPLHDSLSFLPLNLQPIAGFVYSEHSV